MTATARTREQAAALRSLQRGSVLVLPNAWDAGSAAAIAAAGAQAIATTSGGASWSLGRPDGQRLSRAEMTGAVRRIVAAVGVPVTADVEGGYGSAPGDVAETVHAVVAAGAAGVNLEDSAAVGGPLFAVEAQAARLRAAREAGREAGLPDLVINARTDVFLFRIGEESQRLDEVVARTAAYADAGADGVFVPGLLDLDVLAELVKRVPVPVNALAMPGGPSVDELAEAGVRRITVGTAVASAAYTTAHRIASELLRTGAVGVLDGGPDLDELLS